MSEAEVTYTIDDVLIVIEENPVTIIIAETDEVQVIESIETGPPGPPGPTGPGNTDAIQSVSPPGGYIITNIRLNADKKIVITYEDTPVS